MIKPSTGYVNYRWVILGAVSAVQIFSFMAIFSFGPLAPFLLDDLGITRAQLGIFNSLIYLAGMLFSMPVGWFIDKFGIRRLMLLGPGVLGLFFALFSLIHNVSVGYLVVFLVGIGCASVNPVTTMAIFRWFSARSRATALSVKQSALTIGASIGAVLVPSLSIWLGWRITVIILGLGVVAIAILSSTMYKERYQQISKPQSLSLKIFRRLIANKNLVYLGISCAVYFALQICIAAYIVLQLVEVKGMSAVEAGTFLMAANIGGAVGRIFWGYISDNAFGGQRKQILTVIGIISGALAIALSLGFNNMPGYLLYLIIILLGGTAFGYNGVLMALGTELSNKDTAASGLGWALTITHIGAFAGPPIFGFIVDKTSSYDPAWLIFGSMTMVAALLPMLIKGHRVTG